MESKKWKLHIISNQFILNANVEMMISNKIRNSPGAICRKEIWIEETLKSLKCKSFFSVDLFIYEDICFFVRFLALGCTNIWERNFYYWLRSQLIGNVFSRTFKQALCDFKPLFESDVQKFAYFLCKNRAILCNIYAATWHAADNLKSCIP